ncbi:MAG: bifunctional (p)ppGpp synthetase/guanosine-3',5'-bis(diphosphate) 3'-pyrophosphohydrolase, partial [Selenomonas sp.]|nr:bifunctional (p)ppGpp synthetase/guanosine-3',5'-bis(diphosphate) 3'-pyrophosphohydrolase [Selenomonas sp.]
ENIERGMELIREEAKRLGYAPKELLKDGRLLEVAKKLNILSEDDLLAAVGYGGIAVHGILTRLVEFHKEEIKEKTPLDVTQMLSALKRPANKGKSKSSHGVLVEGESGLMVRLARCCNPIPGDPITGYVTRGRGVSVHRTNCPNVLADTDITRMIEVSWDVGLDKQYKVELEIVCNDRSGILANVLAVPTEMKINIHSINANPNRNTKTSTILLGLDVNSSTQVKQIITRLRRVKDVYSVVRKMGSNANM